MQTKETNRGINSSKLQFSECFLYGIQTRSSNYRLFYVVTFLICFGSNFSTTAQDSLSSNSKCKYAFMIGPFVSNDGTNVLLVAQITLNKNSFYFGPTFSYTYSSNATNSFRGLKGGFKRRIIDNEGLVGFASIDYQYYILNAFVKSAYGNSDNNLHHEFNLCYGFEKKISKKYGLWLGSSIGIGFYLENYHFNKPGDDFRTSGLTRHLELYLSYKI